jgi:aspartyl-tRNA(Asn)/glutamyl-tRNA(Gln) amidotransferase subunit C
VETANVEPMAHPLVGQHQRLRPDAVTDSDHHEKYQRNAPQVQAGLYLVPRVIE